MRDGHGGYIELIKAAYDYWSRQPSMDFGLAGDGLLSGLSRQLECRYSPYASYKVGGHEGEGWACGRCLECRRRRANRIEWQMRERVLTAPHRHYLLTLSLPRWPEELPVIDGCVNLGELLYVTPSMFTSDKRAGLALYRVVSGLRREAVKVVEYCFQYLKFGAFAGMHWANDYMEFSPHAHMILCGTMLYADAWPLTMDGNGKIPGLAGAWRDGLGGRRGMSMKECRGCLLTEWAKRSAAYLVSRLLEFKRAFAAIDTKNIVYRLLEGMDEDAIRGLEPFFRTAVLNDSNCVDVKHLQWDYSAKMRDSRVAVRNAIRYAVGTPLQNLEYRDLGEGMVTAGFVRDGKRRSCGKRLALFRRLIQVTAIPRLRAFTGYGFYAAGVVGGKRHDYGKALLAAFNSGYPRTSALPDAPEAATMAQEPDTAVEGVVGAAGDIGVTKGNPADSGGNPVASGNVTGHPAD